MGKIPEKLSANEAAKELGIATSTVIRYCDAGKIEHEKTLTKQYKIPRTEILRIRREGLQ